MCYNAQLVVVIRYDTQAPFTDGDSWQPYDAANTSGLDTGGFDGGIFDGRYIYFAPFTRRVKSGEKASSFHTNCLRYDTAGQFDDPKSWQGYDASRTDNLDAVGYNGGAFDGRYWYLAPWQTDRGVHARVLRYDTIGENGSFSLRYCDYGHNGGLCGAVPGPSFIVNTQKGPLSVSAHQVLSPGWHHISGVYNGRAMKLFIDGVLVAERSGAGSIQENEVQVEIGRIQEGAARFQGVMEEARISNIARNDDWIRTEYRNLVDPEGFIHLGEEH